VAEGNLEVQVDATGNDEVTVLAQSFNQMISGLREGSAYRDLLGRTVSPEVREELRRAFASGEVHLQGQDSVTTVLMSDIHGFTRLSETAEPTTILNWLNEFFGEIIPLIIAHDGVVNQFEGDTVMAFFGILPRPLTPQESAYQACQAALEMLAVTAQLNARRIARGDPPFTVGIGLNTGPVTAGGLGSNDRLHYTIIGDTVNTTTRLQSLTRQFGEESSALISQHTLFALRERRHEFQLHPLGARTFRGKVEQLLVYQLQSAQAAVKERSG
jgi:adenylate cyclase